jgi:hypothetical protein
MSPGTFVHIAMGKLMAIALDMNVKHAPNHLDDPCYVVAR